MMINNQLLKRSLIELGYRSIDVLEDYRYAAVNLPGRGVQRVDVAAFLDVPASYKTAALAIVRTAGNPFGIEEVAAHRALGAPYLVVLSATSAAAWTYTAQGPTKLKETAADQWKALLTDSELRLGPQAVRELKTVRVRQEESQTPSLFDPATLYAVQAETQVAVHDLLQQFLSHFEGEIDRSGLNLERDFSILFPLVFRFLAGKILVDREDPQVKDLDVSTSASVLTRIEELYSLEPLQILWNSLKRKQVTDAWNGLRDGLFVRNVAAEDLAFVYENTLISPEVRRRFGTHSTPSCVADYVVRSLDLPSGARAKDLTVYEPFAGSCVFLTSALRRFKELLPPSDLTPRKAHEHFVRHFRASEIDPFACELARLSLILADYPNHNGWQIDSENLFERDVLLERCKAADVILCNPPFEDFEAAQDGRSIHKPLAALEAILQAEPSYIGIVMPAGFSTHKKYEAAINSAVARYCDVELLKLPEGNFRKAGVGAEVLIAQHPRTASDQATTVRLRLSVVSRADWTQFQRTLRPSTQTSTAVDHRRAPGLTGLRPLRDLWMALEHLPKLGSVAKVHRGLEWINDQAMASKARPAEGFRPGLHRRAGSLDQFRVLQPQYLDCRPGKLRGGALNHDWSLPKVICTAARTSRGPWRVAAAVDLNGLVVSQQFFSIWLKETEGAVHSLTLVQLACILNSPMANAFSYCHDTEKRLRVSTMLQLPLPSASISAAVSGLVKDYKEAVTNAASGPLFAADSRSAVEILLEIDAQILAAYDLPPRLERELLRFMSEGQRPCGHSFQGYPGTEPSAGAISLIQRLSMSSSERTVAWEVIKRPLSEEIADAFDVV